MLKRKLNQDKNAVSSITYIFVIGILIVLGLQYVAPYFGYQSLTEYWNEYQDTKSENIWYAFEIENRNTNNPVSAYSSKSFTESGDFEGSILYYVLDKTESYRIHFSSNVPYSLTQPYSIRFFVKDVKQTTLNAGSTWSLDYLTDNNMIYQSGGKLTSNDYYYNMGSEIRLNDGTWVIYGSMYTLTVISPDNEVLYEKQFLIRMDE